MEMQGDIVRAIVSRYGATSICAGQFFVSWNSVVTLAYIGFSRTLLALKRGIEEGIPGLTPENPGSRWPKTTLGCLRDNVELRENQVHKLRELCNAHNENLQSISVVDRSMDIKELTCVTFHCRTLEKRLSSESILLGGKMSADDSPPESHLEDVGDTMAQFDEEKHADYYPKMAPKGRTIDAYYRVPHVESTLIYDLAPAAMLYNAIVDFRLAVDEALPSCYTWFDPTSWHMTVRALVAKS